MVKNPDITYVAIHHTAVHRSNTQLNAVDRYHRNKWGMKSSLGWYVGYNVFCDCDGTITQTRAIGEETIANTGHNCDIAARCDTVSFCFAGDFNQELPSDKQIAAFKKWKARYPHKKVVGHRDLQTNRTCPGKLMTDDYIQTRLLSQPQSSDDIDDLDKKKIAMLYAQLDAIRAMLRRLLAFYA